MSKYFGNSGEISRIVPVNKGHLSHEIKAKFSKSNRPVLTKIYQFNHLMHDVRVNAVAIASQ